MDLKFKNRYRLREKDAQSLFSEFEHRYGMKVDDTKKPVDVAFLKTQKAIFYNGEIIGLIFNEKNAPSIRGILRFGASKMSVTVDMGAVPFVCNGADVMSPGIREADSKIKKGDIVWINDINNRKPLAIGEAMYDYAEFIKGDRGKAIKSLHVIGDDLWRLGEKPQ